MLSNNQGDKIFLQAGNGEDLLPCGSTQPHLWALCCPATTASYMWPNRKFCFHI